ncbi:hypothetical protein, partial [Mesorhizobium sp. M4A.F.Ca.ET.090.04.2.1]|uniref:hypothetical protein n=1 Tax=Mesorhizobium sp. M4A.F.Ca.ET.090.04.2.1 TaxID=2496663 RepID=UPI001FE133B4
ISGIAVTSIVVGFAGQAVLLWIAWRGLEWTPAKVVASYRRGRFAAAAGFDRTADPGDRRCLRL